MEWSQTAMRVQMKTSVLPMWNPIVSYFFFATDWKFWSYLLGSEDSQNESSSSSSDDDDDDNDDEVTASEKQPKVIPAAKSGKKYTRF